MLSKVSVNTEIPLIAMNSFARSNVSNVFRLLFVTQGTLWKVGDQGVRKGVEMGIVRMWLKALETWGGMGPWTSRYGSSENERSLPTSSF